MFTNEVYVTFCTKSKIVDTDLYSFAAGATFVCSVPDVLQWQSHAGRLMKMRKGKRKDENGCDDRHK